MTARFPESRVSHPKALEALASPSTPGSTTDQVQCQQDDDAARVFDQPSVETAEYASFMRRILKAHAKRCVNGDLDDLAELLKLRELLDQQIEYVITESRRSHGRSWADIGQAAGISRQGAQQRWGHRG